MLVLNFIDKPFSYRSWEPKSYIEIDDTEKNKKEMKSNIYTISKRNYSSFCLNSTNIPIQDRTNIKQALIIITDSKKRLHPRFKIIMKNNLKKAYMHLESFTDINLITLQREFKDYKVINIFIIISSTPSNPYSPYIYLKNSDYGRIQYPTIFEYLNNINKKAKYIILSASCFGLLKHQYFDVLKENTVLITLSDYYKGTSDWRELYDIIDDRTDFDICQSLLLFLKNPNITFTRKIDNIPGGWTYPNLVIFISYKNNYEKRSLSIYEFITAKYIPNIMLDLYFEGLSQDECIKRMKDFYILVDMSREDLLQIIHTCFKYIEIKMKEMPFTLKYKNSPFILKYKNSIDIAYDLNSNKYMVKDYFSKLYKNHPYCIYFTTCIDSKTKFIPYFYIELLQYLDLKTNIIYKLTE